MISATGIFGFVTWPKWGCGHIINSDFYRARRERERRAYRARPRGWEWRWLFERKLYRLIWSDLICFSPIETRPHHYYRRPCYLARWVQALWPLYIMDHASWLDSPPVEAVPAWRIADILYCTLSRLDRGDSSQILCGPLPRQTKCYIEPIQ